MINQAYRRTTTHKPTAPVADQLTMEGNQLAVDRRLLPVLCQKSDDEETTSTLVATTRSMSPEEVEARTPETPHASGWNPFRTSLSSPKLLASNEEASTLQNTTNTPPPSVSRYDRFRRPGKVKQKQKLRSLFENEPGVPSSPNNHGRIVEMTIVTVEARMQKWIKIPPCLLAPETYTKLAYAIGKDLDLAIIAEEGLWGAKTAWRRVDEKSVIGQRFAAVYKSEGNTTATSPPEGSECWLSAFSTKHLSKFDRENDENTYNVLKDPNHGNMQWFRHEQRWGSCHWQGVQSFYFGTCNCGRTLNKIRTHPG